jgi:hypothetical protein
MLCCDAAGSRWVCQRESAREIGAEIREKSSPSPIDHRVIFAHIETRIVTLSYEAKEPRLTNAQRIVAIVSHDAGGAEILASYVALHGVACRFVLEGPAVKIFKRRLGTVDICSLDEGLAACDEVLCGTSWQSDLEWHAIERAQKAGKRVASFLDHWINYPERFIRNSIQHLPDELWVGDADTERLAREHFPDLTIRLEPNPYFIDVQRQLAGLGVRKDSALRTGKAVLYVSENISEHARRVHGDERYYGYTEFDAIEYFLENIHSLGQVVERVSIRPHPADVDGKYDYLMKKYPGLVQLSNGKPLLDEVTEADIVVGSQSTAMVVALLAEKIVVSCIPPGGPECNLPQENIVIFKNLVSSTKLT